MKKILVNGNVNGTILKTEMPINFLEQLIKKLESLPIKIMNYMKNQLKTQSCYFHQVLEVV